MLYDAVIIGGGAAGLFCASRAAQRGKRIAVIEHNAAVGSKILISGGGRCNFTNVDTTALNFVSRNPHFAKSALARYTPQQFIDLVRKYGIDHYEKKLGQLFCRDNARQIVDMLVNECRLAGVSIKTGCRVSNVRKPDIFEIETSTGALTSRNLIVACGGLSFPKIGASDLGYRLAIQFGHNVEPTRPSLVAMKIKGGDHAQLAGISVSAVVKANGRAFEDSVLFTHRGLSGPAVIQASNYWTRDKAVSIDLDPESKLLRFLQQNPKQHLSTALAAFLPERLARKIANEFSGPVIVRDLSRDVRENVLARIHDWRVKFSDTEGYDRAEVTLGGVSTRQLSSTSMESKLIAGLYFIGEVVDVTGWLGGYNFQWAWASAAAAASDLK